MKFIDLITMIGNLSQSLIPIQDLIKVAAYASGVMFCINGVFKLRDLASSTVSSHSSVKPLVPLVYILGGVLLIYLPQFMTSMSNTLFGASNILQYSSYNPYDFQTFFKRLLQTVGVLWFVRGSILLVHSSQPGFQHGVKGLAFLCAGVFAMNMENTVGALDFLFSELLRYMPAVK